MKKIVLFAISLAFTINSNAQLAKVVAAYKYLGDFNDTKDVQSLNKAKEAIDLASSNEDTKEQAKTHNFKCQIYLAIFDYNLRTQTEKLNMIADPNKRTLTGYQNTPTADLATAYEAATKTKQLDEKGKYKSDIESALIRISTHFDNKAIADYNGKKYAEALPSFEKVYEIKGANDTLTLANCALVAERSANYEKAKTYYQKMIEAKAGRAGAYTSLMNANLMLKDTVAGMQALKNGRIAYPNDIALLISETNYYLQTNNSQEALTDLNLAIQAKPNDANLYLVRGNIYDNLANPKDASGKDLEKPKDYEDKMKFAEADYKKAIELKPDYFDALYNLGVMYNNRGVSYNKRADKITDNAKYAEENAKATTEFGKALPILEKALDLKPTDKNTMNALKQIYARTQQLDKLKALNERMKN